MVWQYKHGRKHKKITSGNLKTKSNEQALNIFLPSKFDFNLCRFYFDAKLMTFMPINMDFFCGMQSFDHV